MHPQIEAIFDEAENRYLQSEELQLITQYVESLPERLAAYRALRDQELNVMQEVVDQLQAQLPPESSELLERSIKNALLMLRSCGLSMLLNDESFVKTRFLDWISQSYKVFDTQAIDTVLYRLLNQRLTQVLSSQHMNLLNPMLMKAQNALLPKSSSNNGAVAGW